MAAAKQPEVLIYQLLDQIAIPFQRLTTIFGVLEFKETITNTAGCKRKSEFKDGGRQTESTYIMIFGPQTIIYEDAGDDETVDSCYAF